MTTSSLETLMNDINKKYKDNIAVYGASNMVYAEKIPFSSPRLNYMTYGGFPLGKATELIGEESGGKTTTAIDAIANAQLYALEEWEKELEDIDRELNTKVSKTRLNELTERSEYLKKRGPRRAVLVDTENTFDDEWAELNGVDTDALWLIRPQDQTAEQVTQMMLDILKTGEVIVMVLDSIPMMVSQKLFDKTLEDKAYGGIADVMAAFSAKVSRIISKNKTALILINQVREDLGNPFNLWKTPGGRALKHLYALRLGFKKGSLIDENCKELPNKEGEPAGNLVSITIVKTKVCKPDRRLGFYTLNYTTGIDVIADTLDVAIKYNMVALNGAWHRFIDEETGEIKTKDEKELKFNGRAATIDALKQDDDLFDELYDKVHKKVIGA